MVGQPSTSGDTTHTLTYGLLHFLTGSLLDRLSKAYRLAFSSLTEQRGTSCSASVKRRIAHEKNIRRKTFPLARVEGLVSYTLLSFHPGSFNEKLSRLRNRTTKIIEVCSQQDLYNCTSEFFVSVTKNDIREFEALALEIFAELRSLSKKQKVRFLNEKQ